MTSPKAWHSARGAGLDRAGPRARFAHRHTPRRSSPAGVHTNWVRPRGPGWLKRQGVVRQNEAPKNTLEYRGEQARWGSTWRAGLRRRGLARASTSPLRQFHSDAGYRVLRPAFRESKMVADSKKPPARSERAKARTRPPAGFFPFRAPPRGPQPACGSHAQHRDGPQGKAHDRGTHAGGRITRESAGKRSGPGHQLGEWQPAQAGSEELGRAPIRQQVIPASIPSTPSSGRNKIGARNSGPGAASEGTRPPRRGIGSDHHLGPHCLLAPASAHG